MPRRNSQIPRHDGDTAAQAGILDDERDRVASVRHPAYFDQSSDCRWCVPDCDRVVADSGAALCGTGCRGGKPRFLAVDDNPSG